MTREAAGAHMRLHATGKGVAILKGVGFFSTDDADGRWGPDGSIHFDSTDDE